MGVFIQNRMFHVGNAARLLKIRTFGKVAQALFVGLDGRHATIAVFEIMQSNHIGGEVAPNVVLYPHIGRFFFHKPPAQLLVEAGTFSEGTKADF